MKVETRKKRPGGGRVVEVKRRKKKSINSGVILNARLGKNILAVPFE